MGLKFMIDKLEDVPENVRGLYRPEGDKFVLDVEGAVQKERLDEFRTNNINLQKQLDALKGVDPVKYRELVNIQRQIEEGELIKAGKVDEVVNLRVSAMKEELEGRATSAEKALQKANDQLAAMMIDSQARTVAAKLGAVPSALDDVVLRARALYTMDGGVPVPKDDKGVVFGRDGASPMSIEEWAQRLKKDAPHLFHGSQGSGAAGGNRSPVKDLSKMTPIDLIREGLSETTSLVPDLPREA